MAHDLRDELRRILGHLEGRGFDARELVFEPPASAAEVEALETKLGFRVPPSFREVLLSVSSHVEFRWFAPQGLKFADPFRSNFSGDLHWSLEFAHAANAEKEAWVAEVFPNAADPFDAVWHRKLAFYEVGTGDYIAVDLAPEKFEEIVYLSHEDEEGHGHVLAKDFADLLRRWVPLACTGGEDWQWLPFTNGRSTMLDPQGENAARWRRQLGLEG